MKKLFIVRHAKSDWNIDNQNDIDRSLNARGYVDAHEMGKNFFIKFGKADLIVSSPAIRAMSTALIFCDEMHYDKSKIQIQSNLYESTTADYLNCIKNIHSSTNQLMIIGHNPVINDLCMSFTRKIIDLPPCAIVTFEMINNEWSAISKDNLSLLSVDMPPR
jgi:phosphohistidine phosphatase